LNFWLNAPLSSCIGYQLLFDAAGKPPGFGDLTAPLCLVGVGLALVLLRKNSLLRALYRPWLMSFDAFAFFFLGVAALITLSLVVGTLATWHSFRSALNQSLAVEGVVQDFHAMPFEGHDYEHFTVDGVLFSYSDYVYSGGFNQSRSHGGPMTSGLTVRIHYIFGRNGDTTGPVIVKLEQKCASG
jgi:hypothetical protein